MRRKKDVRFHEILTATWNEEHQVYTCDNVECPFCGKQDLNPIVMGKISVDESRSIVFIVRAECLATSKEISTPRGVFLYMSLSNAEKWGYTPK